MGTQNLLPRDVVEADMVGAFKRLLERQIEMQGIERDMDHVQARKDLSPFFRAPGEGQ